MDYAEIAKLTDKRVKEITMGELIGVLQELNSIDRDIFLNAIRSLDAGKIKSCLEMFMYLSMEKKVRNGE